MSDIKNKVQGVDPNVKARDIKTMASATGNLYETVSVISRRANQLNMDIKKELHFKLEEFAINSDTIEAVSYTHLDVYKRQHPGLYYISIPVMKE